LILDPTPSDAVKFGNNLEFPASFSSPVNLVTKLKNQKRMKLSSKSTALIGLLFLGGTTSYVSAAAMIPLGATGWNQDIVIGAGETAADRTATMDGGAGGGANTWYGIGFNAGAPTTGLPTVLTTSQTSGADLSFQLQPFDTSNAVLDGGNLALTSPTPLARLALIGSVGAGSTPSLSVQVNFADSSSETFNIGNGGIGGDWFNNSPIAFTASGRINVDSGGFDNVNNANPRLYESILTLANQTSNVVSVDITESDNGHLAVMAISGEAIPEPSVSLLGLLALGATALRRRR